MNHFAVHQKLTQHCKSTILQLKRKTDSGVISVFGTLLGFCSCSSPLFSSAWYIVVTLSFIFFFSQHANGQLLVS